MKLGAILAIGACVSAVSAAPQRRMRAGYNGNDDITILNFALVLEHMESEFYRQGLSKFGEADFRRANIPDPTQAILNFHHILQHENQHVETLKSVIESLGGTPVPPCVFMFSMDTVQEFTRLASVLEKVGVSAYNGAVALLEDPDLQTAAATIDTVEARHASFLQTVNGKDPFPADFDAALDGRQVVTLAAPFIKACPFDLGFAPFGALKVDTTKPLLPGADCKVEFQRANGVKHFCNFLFSGQSAVVELSNENVCKIPDDARGDVLLMITRCAKGVTLKNTNTIVAGPLVVNIDTADDDSCERCTEKDEDFQSQDTSEEKPPEIKVMIGEVERFQDSSEEMPPEIEVMIGEVERFQDSSEEMPPEIKEMIDEVERLKYT